ncbi:response regulator [Aquidulcibacter sp.]|uniref:response regulator n=1 Tax=Aquidulcibacter sp. TaxID=2052990 RepID=UPI0037841493
MAASTSIPITILIVDDNQHMRGILKELLRAAGVSDIKEASDPLEAFEYMKSSLVDLLLVDLAMPLMDGVEFTRMVRTNEDSPNHFLPIIMITGHSERSRVNAARDAGVNEFLVKPVTAKGLMERLSLIVNRPRNFVKSKQYFGPDRRRRADPNFSGEERRKDLQAKA